MPRINVKCPQCNLGMTGTDAERFRKPITCPKCGRVFTVAVAHPPPPPLPTPTRSPVRLLAVMGLALLLTVSLGVGLTFTLWKDKPGRRGSGTPGGESSDGSGKRYALIIGVNEYDKLTHLRFAENDAVEMANVLGAESRWRGDVGRP